MRHSLLRHVTRFTVFDTIALDYLSMPKADTGHTTILVAIDLHSKFIWAWPIEGAGTAATTIAAIDDLRCRYTTPTAVYVDGGSHFINAAVSAYLSRHNIKMETSSPYTHVGIVESANHLVLDRLRHLVHAPDATPNNWPQKLQTAVAALNDRVVHHLASYTPREVLFGLQPHHIETAPDDIKA
jgi:transposase InsO family protein